MTASAVVFTTPFSIAPHYKSTTCNSTFAGRVSGIKLIFNNFLDNNTLKTGFSDLEYVKYHELVYDTGFENCKLQVT
jgi:hypothetical protein